MKVTILLTLASIATAAPFSNVTQDSPVYALDVTPGQPALLHFFAQYAGAAYCFSNTHGYNGTVSCGNDNGTCLGIEQAKTTIMRSFHDVGDSGTSGFTVIDDTHKLIVVALQGTAISSNPLSVVTDLSFSRAKTDLCKGNNALDGCLTHDGFHRAMMDVRDIVIADVTDAHRAHPDYQIVSTGHSLGGAIAAVMGVVLRNRGFVVDIYTYGMPHIGAMDLALYIEGQSPVFGNNYRVTHGKDIVSRLPPHSFGNWEHFYPEYYIPNDMPGVDGIWKVLRVEREMSGIGNEAHTSVWRLALEAWSGVDAHRNYFGPIAACNPVFLS